MTLRQADTSSHVPPATAPTVRSLRGLLVIGCVFSLVGGYMDAFSWLAHGHVFANAQTGNVVLFSVYASGGDWPQALRTIPSILAFALGVAVVRLLRVRPVKHTFRATLFCQALELLVLLILLVLHAHLPNALVVPAISFVAALQNTSFAAIGPWEFNSAMTTGNLRTAVSVLVQHQLHEPGTDPGRGIVGGLALLFFCLGALLGALYTRLDAAHGLAPCAALVGVGILLTLRERNRLQRLPPAADANPRA